jgi:hypothetical protein
MRYSRNGKGRKAAVRTAPTAQQRHDRIKAATAASEATLARLLAPFDRALAKLENQGRMHQ